MHGLIELRTRKPNGKGNRYVNLLRSLNKISFESQRIGTKFYNKCLEIYKFPVFWDQIKYRINIYIRVHILLIQNLKSKLFLKDYCG